MTLSPRLVAAGCIRRMALHGATDEARSRVLLGELSGLLRTYYLRGEQRPSPEQAASEEEVTRVGPGEIVAWWAANADSLAPTHRDLASGFLLGAGMDVQ